MDPGEFLQGFHSAEPVHGPLSSSEGKVRILGPVVQPAPGLLTIGGADLFEGGALGAQPVGDDGACPAVPLRRLLDESEGRGLVPLLGDA